MWFPEEEKTKIAEYIKEVKELINNKDVEQLKKKIDELNVLHTIWLRIVCLQCLSIKPSKVQIHQIIIHQIVMKKHSNKKVKK
nr:hypothetical protein [Mycoplasmopsis bovis]